MTLAILLMKIRQENIDRCTNWKHGIGTSIGAAVGVAVTSFVSSLGSVSLFGWGLAGAEGGLVTTGLVLSKVFGSAVTGVAAGVFGSIGITGLTAMALPAGVIAGAWTFIAYMSAADPCV